MGGTGKGVEGRKSQSEVGGLHRMAKGGSDKEGSKICKSIKAGCETLGRLCGYGKCNFGGTQQLACISCCGLLALETAAERGCQSCNLRRQMDGWFRRSGEGMACTNFDAFDKAY